MIKKVEIDANDIFRYVVGNTTIDPIEAQINFNHRYEVLDELIYDHESRKTIPQTGNFVVFSKKVSNLRKMSPSLARDYIIARCEELSKMDIHVDLS